MTDPLEPPPNAANPVADSWVIQSLEASQLTSATAKHYARRQLKPREAILLWTLRIYLLLMLGVVAYQVWTTTR
jgi:hypothetical protein